MKKQFYSVLLLMAGFGGIHAAELAKDPGYTKIQREVDLVRESRFIYGHAAKSAARGATVGAGTVGAGLLLVGPERREKVAALASSFDEGYISPANIDITAYRVGILGGALAGAVAGAGKTEIQRRYTIWRINAALNTTAYDFMALPTNEAVMVMAAYKRNLPVMHTVMPYVAKFLKKRGVWHALAQLYFGASTAEHVNRLKEALELSE